ncbi:MAG: ROK family protein [Clostridia bacterium]|nr:ROK family protein [Clostridia bacterium]
MYRIGIDLGGTNIAAGLVNEKYEIVRKDSTPTNATTRTGEEIAKAIAALCEAVCEAEGIKLADVEAIGIASPGIVDHTNGVVEYSCNLPFRHFPIADLLRRYTGVQNVHAENDANAAAWGEAVAGAARGTTNSIMITLGTGVGGGVIIDNKVISGFNFAGGELGHIVIEKDGALCGCGRKGCWEAYSSATGLIRMTKEKIEECQKQGRSTLMEKMAAEKGKISGRTAFDAMRAGDEAGREVVDKYVAYLATGLTNIINIFQPEVLSIGGGVSGERDNLLNPLLPLINAEKYGAGTVADTKIRIAELGNDAGIIGAAFLGI